MNVIYLIFFNKKRKGYEMENNNRWFFHLVDLFIYYYCGGVYAYEVHIYIYIYEIIKIVFR